jgi:hypothetical protein
LLNSALPLPGTAWHAPGWAAFATSDELAYHGELAARPGTVVAWRDGPMIGPYLRILKQHRAVVVALADSSAVTIHRYARGRLEHLETLRVQNDESPRTAEAHGKAPRTPRSALDTEAMRRRKRIAFDRLASRVASRIAVEAGDEGVIVIGGTPEWAHRAGEALPSRLGERLVVSPHLGRHASAAQIVQVAKRAATEVRAAQSRALFGRVLADAGRRATVSASALTRALVGKAVDLLVVSPRFLRTGVDRAESIMRDALLQGARIELIAGEAAVALDRAANGVAARLRFATMPA